MPAGDHNFTVGQGETFNPTLTLTDSAGALVNLTGYTARMTVRETYSSEASVLDLTTENDCLVERWDLDEPDGLIAYDKSGYGNHGTLVGAPQRVQVFRPDRLPT